MCQGILVAFIVIWEVGVIEISGLQRENGDSGKVNDYLETAAL